MPPTRTSLSHSRVFLLVAALACCWNVQSVAGIFPYQINELGHAPFYVITPDLNGDGRADIVASNFANGAPGDVSVLLSEGDGDFSAQIRAAAGNGPNGLAAGDLNADGKIDLVIANYVSGDVSILIGRGDGTFEPQTRLGTGLVAFSVAIADFDSDGRGDLMVSNNGSGYLSLHFGRGDGTFESPHHLVGLSGPAALLVGDYNEDGKPDVAVTNDGDGTAAVYLGFGDGRFADPSLHQVGDFPESIAQGDLDADGHLDLVIANAVSDDISILYGDGTGDFGPAEALSVGDFPLGVAVGDFTADGIPDIMTANTVSYVASTGDMSLLVGAGSRQYQSDRRLPVGPGPAGLDTADFDGDHLTDVVIVGPTLSQGAAVLLNNGDGTIGDFEIPIPVTRPGYFITEDLTSDAVDDMVVVTPISFLSQGGVFFPGFVSFFQGLGDGTFRSAGAFFAGDSPRVTAIADLDGNGMQDLIVTSHSFQSTGPGFLQLFLFDAQLHFVSRFVPLTTNPGNLLVTDLNHDQKLDLVFATVGSNPFNPGGVTVMLGRGDATFGPESTIQAGFQPGSMLILDLDIDGDSDLVVSNTGLFGPGSVSVYLGRGDGSLSPQPTVLSDTNPAGLASGDFDQDGKVDLAVGMVPSDLSLAGVTVLPGRGDGTFGPPKSIYAGAAVIDLTVSDFDSDGILDIAAKASALVLLRGQGDGTFKTPLRFRFQRFGGQTIRSGDYNSDGRPDVSFSRDGAIGVYLNHGPFPNHAPVAFASAQSPVDCTSPNGALVTLDASSSTDADSTPGTHDDIVSFEWFEGFGTQAQVLLGAGESLSVPLALGDHVITLKVTDSRGVSATAELQVSVLDSGPPSLALHASPSILWPPNHRMVDVQVAIETHACLATNVVLTSVVSDEPDDAPGGSDGTTVLDIQGAGVGTQDAVVQLRAERDAQADGRAYTLVYTATDSIGRSTEQAISVLVPHDRAGVTEPVTLSVEASGNGTLLRWDPVPGGIFYNAVRGDVASLLDTGQQIDLGPLNCLERRSLDTTTLGHEDRQAPLPGRAFFYLVEYNDGLDSSFGSEDVKKPRVKGSGGCGSSGRLTATGE